KSVRLSAISPASNCASRSCSASGVATTNRASGCAVALATGRDGAVAQAFRTSVSADSAVKCRSCLNLVCQLRTLFSFHLPVAAVSVVDRRPGQAQPTLPNSRRRDVSRLMPLIALGLNHLTAPVSLREQVAFDEDAAGTALLELAREPGVEEAMILSTCNRTELYVGVATGAEDIPQAWLSRHHHLTPGKLDEFLYRHEEQDAVRHMFRVATGLDSMVLGEPQILGQVKNAYQQARHAQALKAPLDRLLQHTFAVAKRVRTDTRIGAHTVSVAFTAVRLAEQVFTDLEQACVLLIGAGDTIELAARHLAERR